MFGDRRGCGGECHSCCGGFGGSGVFRDDGRYFGRSGAFGDGGRYFGGAYGNDTGRGGRSFGECGNFGRSGQSFGGSGGFGDGGRYFGEDGHDVIGGRYFGRGCGEGGQCFGESSRSFGGGGAFGDGGRYFGGSHGNGTGWGGRCFGGCGNFGGGGGFGDGRQSFGGGGGYGGGRRAIDFMPSRQTDWSATPPIQKNFYSEDSTIAARNQREIDQWLHDNQCTLNGENIPRPIFEFSESGFPKPIVELLYKHYQRPTVIQSISWPVALSGRDMISIAKTGSGKTLGFILPAIVHTLNQPKRQAGDGPSIVVLLPTRELAVQVEEVTREYCKIMQLEAACCYGGAPKTYQQRGLRKGVDICIATPGRLLDHLRTSTTNMRRCTYLVLDEADRMLDMGFEPQIRAIVEQIRPDRQTLMFSATWPQEVRALAADFQQNPLHLNVGSLQLTANHNVLQYVEVIEEYHKTERLVELFNYIFMCEPQCKILIFVYTKHKADYLTRFLREEGWPVLCIHGDKQQREREWVLGEFKAGRTSILLATDVFARGLDVNDIKYVINYDYPKYSVDYVHRIGRTGRQGKTGTSYTFFRPDDAPKARDLIKVLEEAHQDVPEELRNLTSNLVNIDLEGYGDSEW